MIIPNKGISTYVVRKALGTSATDYGTLCTHLNINPWSKWKPIKDSISTMTLLELKNLNFGISVLQGTTVTDIKNKIDANGGVGFTYNRPTGTSASPYRIGDFRNYYSDAPIVTTTLYENNEVVKIGGVTASNHNIYEVPILGDTSISTEYSLGVEDVYHFKDTLGNVITLRRGALITDGTHTVWYTDFFYWWTNLMLIFKDKTVTVYEFYTNTVNTPDQPYTQRTSDKFYALPYSKYTLLIKSDSPAGSKIVNTFLDAMFTNGTYKTVNYSLEFDSYGEVCRGGVLNNIIISLCRDSKGIDVITTKQIAASITVPDESSSLVFTGTLDNRPDNTGYIQPDIYIFVYFNGSTQYESMVEENDSEAASFIIKAYKK